VNYQNKYEILSKHKHCTYLIRIAPCFRTFPMFRNVASAREWDFTAQMFLWHIYAVRALEGILLTSDLPWGWSYPRQPRVPNASWKKNRSIRPSCGMDDRYLIGFDFLKFLNKCVGSSVGTIALQYYCTLSPWYFTKHCDAQEK